jgi:glycosyltransferase involved in cell wall biosynthesis
MKVTIVMSFPFPEGKATANRVKALANELIQKRNVDSVEIICCSDRKKSTYQYEKNVKVTTVKVSDINKNRLFYRAIHELRVALKFWGKAQESHADVIIVTVPSIFLLVPIAFGTRGADIVLDVRDAVWTYLGKGVISRFASVVMACIFRLASKNTRIISVTNMLEASHIEKIIGIYPLVISNGISKTKLEDLKALKVFSIGKTTNIAYIGNVGIAQDLDTLIDLSKEINNITVTIVGDGAKLSELKKRCFDEGLGNVFFTGLISSEKVLKYIGQADILFAQIGPNFASAVPTKIFEYIASGRPVLLGLPNGPAKEIFSEFKCLEIFDTGNLESCIAFYRKLILTEQSAAHRQFNIDLLETHYLREISAKKLSDAVAKLPFQR